MGGRFRSGNGCVRNVKGVGVIRGFTRDSGNEAGFPGNWMLFSVVCGSHPS